MPDDARIVPVTLDIEASLAPALDNALTRSLAGRLVSRMLELVTLGPFEPGERLTDCRDPKDDRYSELALAAGANRIVSSDADLLVLDPWRGLRFLPPADYLAEAGSDV